MLPLWEARTVAARALDNFASKALTALLAGRGGPVEALRLGFVVACLGDEAETDAASSRKGFVLGFTPLGGVFERASALFATVWDPSSTTVETKPATVSSQLPLLSARGATGWCNAVGAGVDWCATFILLESTRPTLWSLVDAGAVTSGRSEVVKTSERDW